VGGAGILAMERLLDIARGVAVVLAVELCSLTLLLHE
jgi:hypothetical protein